MQMRTCRLVRRLLWMGRILERKAADHARALPHKVVAPVPDGEQVRVPRVPADRRDLLALAPFRREAPQREERTLALPELVALVFPIPVGRADREGKGLGVCVCRPLCHYHCDRRGH